MMLRYTYLLILFVVPLVMGAQDLTALDYFNRASKEYVKQDKLTALRTLDEALRHHPGDPRLLKLAEELLKEEQQQQQQEQQQNEQDQQQEQNENKEKEGDKEKENEGSGEKDRKEKEQENEKKEEGSKDPKPGEKQQQEQKAAGKIDPQDARRILDALDRQEKDVQEKIRAQQRPANRVPIEKDW